MISCYVYRVESTSPNNRRRIQASRKPISSPIKATLFTKASLSWSDRRRVNLANLAPLVRLSFSSPLSFVSMEDVAFAQLCLLGQTLVRCPLWEHLKHCPSSRCFCLSASVVAFRTIVLV